MPPAAGTSPSKALGGCAGWVEAATTAVRDPQLDRFTAQIAQRRGPKVARVALARRLLTLCYSAPARRRLPCPAPSPR